jgi:hypothetical protein
MNDQFLTHPFLLCQLPIAISQDRVTGPFSRPIRPVEAGYEYDEHELGEGLAASRKRQPLPAQADIEPDDFEAVYKYFLS